MGFLSKLTKSFSGSGVDLSLTIPESIALSEQSIPVGVTIRNGTTELRQITSVSIKLVEETLQPQEGVNPFKVITESTHTEPILLEGGTISTTNYVLTLNDTAQSSKEVGEGSQIIANLVSLIGITDLNNVRHSIEVKIGVEGVLTKPSKSVPIKLVR